MNQKSRDGFVMCSLQDRSCQPPRVRRTAANAAHRGRSTSLERAIAFFDSRGIQVRRVLTDNAYKRIFREACERHGAHHSRTRPYHPWTNGRAEVLINTLLRECLYAAHYTSDEARALAIALFVAYYNAERPHTGLDGLSPERWLRAHGVTRVYGNFS